LEEAYVMPASRNPKTVSSLNFEPLPTNFAIKYVLYYYEAGFDTSETLSKRKY
jgi:hypothetical protein